MLLKVSALSSELVKQKRGINIFSTLNAISKGRVLGKIKKRRLVEGDSLMYTVGSMTTIGFTWWSEQHCKK